MAQLQRAIMFGVPIDLLTREETVNLIKDAMVRRQRLHHVALNVAKLVAAQSNQELHDDVSNADIVGADGMGLLLAARILGVKIPERVTGVDLMFDILSLCAELQFRPYLLGATDVVLDRAIAEAMRRWPRLHIAGAHNGYFSADEERAIVADIQNSGADCLFVAMPTPLKERFCHRYRESLTTPFIMGVGGSFDILAGKTRRAPVAVQRAGLEWAYRTLQEPRRMWKRYLFSNAAFASMLINALLARTRAQISVRDLL